MSTLQNVLSAANHHTGLTSSVLNIYAPNSEYIVITFNAAVRKSINASLRYDCDIETIFDKHNEESYMALLNEITDIFYSLQYAQHAACDFIEWRKGYNNAIRKHMYNKPPLVYGATEARKQDIAIIFANIENTIEISNSNHRPKLTVKRRGEKEIGIETRYDKVMSLRGDSIPSHGKSKMTIPYKVEGEEDFYKALLQLLEECLQRACDHYEVNMIFSKWRRSFCRQLYMVTGITII